MNGFNQHNQKGTNVMPAFSTTDLPTNAFLEIERVAPDPDSMPRIQHLSNGDTLEFALCHTNRDSTIAQVMICYLDKQSDQAWMVCHSEADDGWGPLIYDLAMEFTSADYGGLVPDVFGINEPAKRIWQFYFEKRAGCDVSVSEFHVSPWNEQSETPLRHRYVAKDQPNLTFLKESDRIVIRY